MSDPTPQPRPLVLANLSAWYGEGQALHQIGFDVRAGEVVTLLGRNGAGKTTIMRSIVGLLRSRTGSIQVHGVDTLALSPRRIARLGLGFVPEERGIFGSLSVEENLWLPPQIAPGGLTVAQIYELFPNIQRRLGSRGSALSGGEQQMLAIARILRTGARTLLLDEPTEGLAPVIIDHIRATLLRIRRDGFTMLLVEQNLAFARSVSDRYVIIENGRVVDEMTNADFDASAAKLKTYVGV